MKWSLFNNKSIEWLTIYRAYAMDQYESAYKFSKYSGNFHKPYINKFYSIQIASEGLLFIVQCEIIEKSPHLEV